MATQVKKHFQEKFMAIMTLFFFGGVVMYSILPEGPVKDMGMALFVGGLMLTIIKAIGPSKAHDKA